MAYKQELWDEAKKKCRLGDEEIDYLSDANFQFLLCSREVLGKKEAEKTCFTTYSDMPAGLQES